MAGEGTDPTDDLHGRESLTPVFENLNTYEATTHFNGQSTIVMIASLRYRDTFIKEDATWRFGERRLYVDWTETRSVEAAT
jgi:hypothetical protein